MTDVSVQNEGSIVLLRPLTHAAASWFKTFIPDDSTWFGGALIVEPRFVHDLLAGMRQDGLKIG